MEKRLGIVLGILALMIISIPALYMRNEMTVAGTYVIARQYDENGVAVLQNKLPETIEIYELSRSLEEIAYIVSGEVVIVDRAFGKLNKEYKAEIMMGGTIIVLGGGESFLENNFGEFFSFIEKDKFSVMTKGRLRNMDQGLASYMGEECQHVVVSKKAATINPNKKLNVLYYQDNQIGGAYLQYGLGRIYYISAVPEKNDKLWEYIITVSQEIRSAREELVRKCVDDERRVSGEWFFEIEPGAEKHFTVELKEACGAMATDLMVRRIGLKIFHDGQEVNWETDPADINTIQFGESEGKYDIVLKNDGSKYKTCYIFLTEPAKKQHVKPFTVEKEEYYFTNKALITLKGDTDSLVGLKYKFTCLGSEGGEQGMIILKGSRFRKTFRLTGSSGNISLRYIEQDGRMYSETYVIIYDKTAPEIYIADYDIKENEEKEVECDVILFVSTLCDSFLVDGKEVEQFGSACYAGLEFPFDMRKYPFQYNIRFKINPQKECYKIIAISKAGNKGKVILDLSKELQAEEGVK